MSLSKDFGRPFWSAAATRAIRTAAQSAVAILSAGAVGIVDADWATVGSVSGLAFLLSVLTAVATGLPESGTPVPVALVVADVTPDPSDEEPVDEPGRHATDRALYPGGYVAGGGR